MKRLTFTLPAVVAFLLCSCGAEEKKELTPMEKIESAIQSYSSPDSVANIQVIDTVTIAELDNSDASLDEASAIIDSQAVRLPEQIKATEERIANAKKEYDEASDMLFKTSWMDILMSEEKNLANFKDLQVKNKALADENADIRAWNKKIRENAEGETGCYVFTGTVNGEEKKYFVSPKFTVLNE